MEWCFFRVFWLWEPCTWRHSQVLGAVFDHSPMAPPIVHPVKVCLAAGVVLGPGTLVKGGYGLSRPGGNLGLGFWGLQPVCFVGFVGCFFRASSRVRFRVPQRVP